MPLRIAYAGVLELGYKLASNPSAERHASSNLAVRTKSTIIGPMKWEPDWAIHPGVTVAELLVEMNLTVRIAAKATGISEEDLTAVVECRAPITEEIASGLARLPASKTLFLNLQRDHEQSLARGARDITNT